MLAGSVQDAAGSRTIAIDNLIDGQVYMVRAFPVRHRPVGQFVMVRDKTSVELVCPIHPDRVAVTFPAYETLAVELRDVLGRSEVEGLAGRRGEDIFQALESEPFRKAGLLNLFAKMNRTPLGGTGTTWRFVDALYRIRGDRVFANVKTEFRDLVKTAVGAGQFREVSGSLHTPPAGFHAAGSFKSQDRYGNVQLTFFANDEAPPVFKIDADIDDAGGIEHVFQVLRNFLTDGETHPYDIQQILLFHQQIDPGYQLTV
jgi:hypothetical protein